MCGIEAVTYAKKICPVDIGRLRASISYLVADSNTVIVGTNVEYASDVELGTSRQKAQPYMEPAIANHTDEYMKIVKSALGR